MKLMLTEHVKPTGGEMSLAVWRKEKNFKALIPFPGSAHSTLHTDAIFKTPLLIRKSYQMRVEESCSANMVGGGGEGLLFTELVSQPQSKKSGATAETFAKYKSENSLQCGRKSISDSELRGVVAFFKSV